MEKQHPCTLPELFDSYSKNRQSADWRQNYILPGLLFELQAAGKWINEDDQESKTGLTWILCHICDRSQAAHSAMDKGTVKT